MSLLVLLVVIPLPIYAFLFALLAIWSHTFAEIAGRGTQPFWRSGPPLDLTKADWLQEETPKPFWEYVEPLTGIKLPYPIGFVGFLGLGTILTVLAFLGCLSGYLYGWYAVSDFCICALFGAWLGDFIISHVGLSIFYKFPNPGLYTSIAYVVGCFVIYNHVVIAWLPAVLGFMAFAGFWALVLVRFFLRGRTGFDRL